jgi:hypothetical protein
MDAAAARCGCSPISSRWLRPSITCSDYRCSHFVARGCGPDILMAASLGDLQRVRRHLEADPANIRMLTMT